MTDYIRLSRILKKIGVNDVGNYIINNILYDENIKNLISKEFYMNGGGNDILEDKKVKKTIITYDGVDYEFTSYHENEMKYYHLYGKNTTCITIIINEELKIAKIHEMNNDYDCFPVNIKGELKSGSTLLKLSLKLIEKIKEKYCIKYVGIHDLSTKPCHNLKGERINFSKMMILMSGETWYGKYGFTPYDQYDKIMTKKLLKEYENNKKIMNTAKMQDIKKFKFYFEKAVKKSNLTKNIEEKVVNLFNECYDSNDLIKDFIEALLNKNLFMGNADKKISGTCVVFYYFYNKLFDKLKLYDFRGKSFIRNI